MCQNVNIYIDKGEYGGKVKKCHCDIMCQALTFPGVDPGFCRGGANPKGGTNLLLPSATVVVER